MEKDLTSYQSYMEFNKFKINEMNFLIYDDTYKLYDDKYQKHLT